MKGLIIEIAVETPTRDLYGAPYRFETISLIWLQTKGFFDTP